MALLFIFLLLIIGILGLFFIPDKNIGFLKKWSLTVSGLVWCFSSIIFSNFDTNFYSFQYVLYYTIKHNVLNLTFFLGLDGISLCFFF